MVGKRIGKRNNEHPGIDAVEQEGDDCLPAGAEGEVGGVQKGVLGHKDCRDHDKIFGQFAHVRSGVVQHREVGRQYKHYQCDAGTAEDGKSNQLVVLISGFRHPACSQQLPYDNGNRITQRDEDNVKHVADGIGNILGGDHVQAADRIAL